MDRRDAPTSHMRALCLALVILLLGFTASALARISTIKPGKAPELNADEGLLVVALDTDVHIDRGFVQREGAKSELVVLKEAEPGRNLRLLKFPAGRYHWHSLRIGNWQINSTMLVWPLSGRPEYEFEVRPGVINYLGEIVFRRSDSYGANLYVINHGLRALDWLRAVHPATLAAHEFRYGGRYGDPFPGFYREALAAHADPDPGASPMRTPPEPVSLPIAPTLMWQQDRVQTASLNPRGDVLAIQVKEDGKEQWYVDLVDLKHSLVQRIAKGDTPFDNLLWAGDEDLVLSADGKGIFSQKVRHREADRFVSAVHVARTSASMFYVEAWSLPWPGRVLDAVPIRPGHVVLESLTADGQVHVEELDIRSKQAFEAYRNLTGSRPLNWPGNGEHGWLVDGEGRPAVALTNVGLELVLSRPQEGKLVEFLRLNSESAFVPVATSRNGASLYAITDENRTQRDLVEYDIAAAKVTGTLFSRPGIDVHSTIFGPGRQPIGVRYYQDGNLLSEYFDASNQHVVELLKQAFPGRMASVIDKSADGTQLILWVEASDSTPKLYHLDRRTGKARLIEDSMPWLKTIALAPSQVLAARSSDGLAIQSYLTLPSGSGKRPLVVMPHGGPVGVSDSLRFDRDTQFLASLGYAVLRVNFRGSDGYGKAFRDAGHGSFGTAIEDDIDAALKVALASHPLDEQRMCVLGFSYGGYSALVAAVRWPERFRCAISVSGVSDRNLQFTASDTGRSEVGRKQLELYMGNPDSAREKLIETSPAYQHAKLRVPVMLVHGVDDQRVDYEQTLRMQRMLELDGRPPVGLVFEKEGHMIQDLANIDTMWKGIAGFLQKHLGKGESGAAENKTEEKPNPGN